MSINPVKLEEIFETLKNDLGEGFIATDLWPALDSRPLLDNHGYNSNPKAVTLLNEVTVALNKTLKVSEYPGLGNYYMINLDNNHLIVVISVGTYQQFLIVDLSETTMGILMNVAMPNLLNGLAEVETVEDPIEAETINQQSNPPTLRAFLNTLSKVIYKTDLHLLTKTGEDEDSFW